MDPPTPCTACRVKWAGPASPRKALGHVGASWSLEEGGVGMRSQPRSVLLCFQASALLTP